MGKLLMLILFTVIRAFSVNLAAQESESSGDPRVRFVGTWSLVSVERFDADGVQLASPQGEEFGAGNPKGFIMYDSAGYMGVVIQQDRQQSADDEALLGLRTYTSYFGPFSVNQDEGFVTHHVRGNLNPSGTGRDNRRYFEFSGNQLALKPPIGPTGIQLRIVWERMPPLSGLTPEQKRFVGFWAFDSMERFTLDGELVPTEKFEVGYLTYMPSGQMAVHLMRAGRQSYENTVPTPEEAREAMDSYVSYFGPFTVHADDGYVLHHREGSSRPSGRGLDAQRFYDLDHSKLILRPPVTTVDGREVQSLIHWRRLHE